MNRIILTISLIALLIIIIGADFRRAETSTVPTPSPVAKKKCLGYTIIEFGKGIDCNGDTVKLIKVNGVQVLAESVQ